MQFLNHYCHKDCEKQPGIEWELEWDCTCNDKCPACNMEIEPHKSEDRGDDSDEKLSDRDQYDNMLRWVGCPECGDEDTHETLVTIDGKDNVVACVCNECGHTMKSPRA